MWLDKHHSLWWYFSGYSISFMLHPIPFSFYVAISGYQSVHSFVTIQLCFSLYLLSPTHTYEESISLFKTEVYFLNAISHWYTTCHHQAVCAKSPFWQRFYTPESKAKGSYQQTHTQESLTLSLWQAVSCSQTSPKAGRLKPPRCSTAHTSQSWPFPWHPPHPQHRQWRLKCFWGYGNPIRAGPASISTILPFA